MFSDSYGAEESGDDVVEEEEEDSQESSSVVEEETSQEAHQQSQPLAKDHSYLAASHPLLPDKSHLINASSAERSSGSLSATANSIEKDDARFFASSHERKDPFELAVLELQGVVLFPGSTIPIILRNKTLIQYLGRQIQQCRTHPELQPKVELGVMALTESYSSFPTHRLHPREGNERYFTIYGDRDPRSRLLRRLRQRENQHQALSQNPRYQEPSSSTEIIHPYIGKIGTIATIRHTHERGDATASSNSVWSQYEDANELVLTAVGTSRFRIVDVVDDGSRRSKIFMVEELVDDPMAWPLPFKPFSSGMFMTESDDTNDDTVKDDASRTSSDSDTFSSPITSRQPMLACNLSEVTPVPYHVHRYFSPWSLMERIIEALESNAGSNNLPALGSSDMDRKQLEPNNVPFTETQRLRLLSMDSTLDRLLTIWKDIAKMIVKQVVICCDNCHSILSFAKDVFTVGGAEGSTSAYVNAAGYIHQITTLRDLMDENKVVLEGHPSTHNSYFPGYSWHITVCRRCDCMLGWKFRKVCKEATANKDRPETFFGFMSSNVMTKQLN